MLDLNRLFFYPKVLKLLQRPELWTPKNSRQAAAAGESVTFSQGMRRGGHAGSLWAYHDFLH